MEIQERDEDGSGCEALLFSMKLNFVLYSHLCLGVDHLTFTDPNEDFIVI